MAIAAFSVFVVLDTFLIPRGYSAAQDTTFEEVQAQAAQSGETSASAEDGQAAEAAATADAGSTGTAATEDSSTASSSGNGRGSGRGHGPGSRDGSSSSSSSSSGSSASSTTTATNDSTTTENGVQVSITTDYVNGTTVYVADIVVSSAGDIRTALAGSTYGKNITAATSEMAADNNALLAINGDYYGARNDGYVIRNGTLYRDTAASADQEDLVIYADGTFEIVTEGEVTAQELVERGAWQVFSFGPGLVENGQVTVDEDDEVGKAMASNPRTAIGQIGEGHYVMVVADGRTDASEGLSLHEFAEYLQGLGVKTAYNLDGGGSSTMYYNGAVINNPTSGHGGSERSVSDIVYIGA